MGVQNRTAEVANRNTVAHWWPMLENSIIGANVNYSARVQVRFMQGDPAFASNFQSWLPIPVSLSDPNNTSSSIQVEVQNLDTVRRFKSDLYQQLFRNARQMMMVVDEDRWPETSLYRKRRSGAHEGNRNSSKSSDTITDSDDNSLELIPDFEALYTFGLADGDELILLLHNTDQDQRLTSSLLFEDATISSSSSSSSSSSPSWPRVDDPVASWVESIRRQKEFEHIVA
ncbi:hypothetical protein BGZ73_000900 [Actinomortierella ambigua]|nr:hypothetical protein BGZ73_000900 [Actinomortierella ambigua]